jgi:hypothetical protein
LDFAVAEVVAVELEEGSFLLQPGQNQESSDSKMEASSGGLKLCSRVSAKRAATEDN